MTCWRMDWMFGSCDAWSIAQQRLGSRCEWSVVGSPGMAVIVGMMSSNVRSHSADGKCHALPSMVLRLRVEGWCGVI